MPIQRSTKLIFVIVLVPFLTVGIIFLLLWVSLRPHSPKFHIQEFSIPALGQPNGYENSHITFNVTIRNPNRKVWIHYKFMRGAVYYKDELVGVVPILESYHQKPKNTTSLRHVLSGNMAISTMNLQRWMQLMNYRVRETVMQFMNDRLEGAVVFSLRLTSIIEYKKSMWDKKSHKLRAHCNVGVGPNGLILPSYKDTRCHLHDSIIL